MKLEPVNKKDLAANLGAPVIPASMADQIKPDTANLPPPGHARDEVMRDRRDRLEAQIAQMPSDDRGGVDVSKIPIENEVAGAFDFYGNLPVSRQNSKYVYKWKHASDRSMAVAQHLGFEPVSGDPRQDPSCQNWEGLEYIGKHCAQTTTLRGHVDVILCRMPREKYEKFEADCRQRGVDMGQIEENLGAQFVRDGAYPQHLLGGFAEDPATANHPLIQRVFANGPMESARMDRMMRQGSLPGATASQMLRR